MNHSPYTDLRPGSIEAQIIEYKRELTKLRKQLSAVPVRKIEDVMRLNARIEETKLYIEILADKLGAEA